MNGLMVVVNIIIAVWLAYNAGSLNSIIDINKIDGINTPWYVWALKYGSLLISVYIIVALYGNGLQRCLQL